MTATLAQFATSDAELIGPSEWTTAASAFHTAGLLISRRGETPNSPARVNDLYIAMSAFSSHTRRSLGQRATLTARDLFFNDRAIADTILTLKGWWNSGSYQPEVMEPLGAVLAQVGLASGSNRWPLRNSTFPNLAGAFWVFFDEADLSLLEVTQKLLRPFSYFEAAAAWRPGNLGYQEMILASVLDGHPVSRTSVLGRSFPLSAQQDRTVRSMNEIIDDISSNDGRNTDLLKPLIKASDTFSGSTSLRHDAHLPDFLRTAAEPLN